MTVMLLIVVIKEQGDSEMRHPIVVQAYAREMQRDALREAERRRMVRLAQAGRPGLAERLSGRMSGLLAAARERLQEQRIPSPTPQTGRPLEGLE
jgi:ribosomal protein S3